MKEDKKKSQVEISKLQKHGQALLSEKNSSQQNIKDLESEVKAPRVEMSKLKLENESLGKENANFKVSDTRIRDQIMEFEASIASLTDQLNKPRPRSFDPASSSWCQKR